MTGLMSICSRSLNAFKNQMLRTSFFPPFLPVFFGLVHPFLFSRQLLIHHFLTAENKRRPPLSSIIAGSSGTMKADEVAEKTLNGIKYGRFIIPCNFLGYVAAIATAGLSPQRSYIMAFMEVGGAGIARLVGLFFQWYWHGSIEKWHAQNKQWPVSFLQQASSMPGRSTIYCCCHCFEFCYMIRRL